MGDYERARTHMVDNQLRTNDVTDHALIDAISFVPRERFVPASRRPVAYSDQDVPVLVGDTTRYMMKPHVLGKLIQLAAVRESDVVLCVGCTTGYSVAVLSQIAASVVGVELDEATVAAASELLIELGIDNAAIVSGDLATGAASEGPYDVILIDGAIEELPDAIVAQLKDGGRIVTVEGTGGAGMARVHVRSGDVVSARFGFNASAHVVPGFEKTKTFVF